MSDVEWCQNCGDVVTDDGCACAAIPKPTGVLTREQVEEVFNAVYWHGDQQGAKQCKVLDGIDALRATITQQAQELERVKEDLDSSRTQVSTLQASDRAYAAASADNVQQRLLLADQLAAMTTERDTIAARWKEEFELRCEGEDRLAASQARCAKFEAIVRDHQNGACNRTIAQLQATLAAREALKEST